MEHLKFANTEFLYVLLAIPTLLLLFWWRLRWRKKAISKFGDQSTLEQLMLGRPRYKYQMKHLFILIGVAFLSLGMANLQMGTKTKEVERKGVDVMIALDLSRSMRADDVGVSRMEKAKQFISGLLDEMANDRVGLIVFAGNAYVQMPLTLDYAAARIYLNTVNPDMVPTQGTAIGDAIEQGVQSFNDNQQKYKTMLIISDGENHQGDAIEAAQSAREEGVVIHTLGTGTPDGAPIPIKENGRQVDFVRNQQGNVVVSKMNESMLQNISNEGGGSYIRLGNITKNVEAILDQFAKMEKREIGATVYTDYSDHFQYFIGAALFFLVGEFLMVERASEWVKKIQIFR